MYSNENELENHNSPVIKMDLDLSHKTEFYMISISWTDCTSKNSTTLNWQYICMLWYYVKLSKARKNGIPILNLVEWFYCLMLVINLKHWQNNGNLVTILQVI